VPVSDSKIKAAAATALAAAAVKAKLLADQEEREIQRLVVGVIQNQVRFV
jgi:SWI/SNF related-matrix-associated actin-dependent regulator of chromatin subfamily C